MPSHKYGSSTCREKRWSSGKWCATFVTVTALSLQACATQSTLPSRAVQCPEPSKVPVMMACPSSLEPLADDTMGSLANALMSAAETYYACRAAAVAR